MSFASELARISPVEDESHIGALQALVERSRSALGDASTPEVVFSYLERHSSAYFGSPGPLVHFLERSYPSYVGALLESLERLPLFTTLWMANRVLNSKPDPALAKRLLQALGVAASHPAASEEVRTEATEFLRNHVSSGG